MFSSNDLALQHLQRPPRKAFGWRRAGQRDQLRFAGAVKDPAPGGIRRALGRQHAVDPFLDELLADARNCHQAGVQSHSDLAVGQCLAGFGGVGLQQDARAQQLARRMLAGSEQRFQPLALFGAQRDDIPLDRSLSRRHRIDPRSTEASSIRRNQSLSMTRGTSGAAQVFEFCQGKRPPTRRVVHRWAFGPVENPRR